MPRYAAHGLDGLGGQPALLVLGNAQRRHHRRLLLVGRDIWRLAVDFRAGIAQRESHVSMFTVTHRSISPNTMSCVPMMATTSAIMWPLAHLVQRREVRKAGRADLQR
jgi:hypothetical protein